VGRGLAVPSLSLPKNFSPLSAFGLEFSTVPPKTNSWLRLCAVPSAFSMTAVLLVHISTDIMFLTTEKRQPTSNGRSVTVAVGSVVNFTCALDVDCFSQPVKWTHYQSSSKYPEYWYNGQKVKAELGSRGVTVENHPSRGLTVLTIPSVRMSDGGRFICRVTDLTQCRLNFNLTVTGNLCTIYCLIVTLQVSVGLPYTIS